MSVLGWEREGRGRGDCRNGSECPRVNWLAEEREREGGGGRQNDPGEEKGKEIEGETERAS